jgi:hypothetical protein
VLPLRFNGVLLGFGMRFEELALRPSILSEVKPPTGEPAAGDPLVRFGGKGSHILVRIQTWRLLDNMTSVCSRRPIHEP